MNAATRNLDSSSGNADVEAFFEALNVPLIDKGIQDIQNAKDRFGPQGQLHSTESPFRVLLTSGTGSTPQEGARSAKVERRPR